MQNAQVLIGLLVAVALLAPLAGLLRVPYPILLVLGGLGLGFVPGLPAVQLEPDLVFFLFLPPLLYAGAFFSSPRDLRKNAWPISKLALGLVVASIVAVAVVAHLVVPGLSWTTAFVLGAIVSPTDPTAATAVFRRLGVSERLVTILEGESLVNDGVALVAYRLAVVAVITGSFSLWQGSLEFVLVSAGGILIGLVLGWLIAQGRRRLDDPPVEITISFVTPFAAYLLAEELGVSGVLATVTVGLYLGWRSAGLFLPGTRLQAYAFWNVVGFLANSMLFVLVGLQFPGILAALSADLWLAIGTAVLVSLVLVAVRMAWQFAITFPIREMTRHEDASTSTRERLMLGWSGMRGGISLAAALSLPLTVTTGAPFPLRDFIIFVTFGVILLTLVGQGLTLPPLVRRLGLAEPAEDEREEAEARVESAHAALATIEEEATREDVPEDVVERMRDLYSYRAHHAAAPLADGEDGGAHESAEAFRRLRAKLISAERESMQGMRERGELDGEVLRRIERDLDLEESRLEE
ncbi:MAG: Na+/H+ antiporter [Thermoleophilaceae bacterium]